MAIKIEIFAARRLQADWQSPRKGKSPSRKGKSPDNAKSPGARKLDGACAKILGGDLLSHMMICSIIGDKELNCRVRNGIGCTLLSMAAKKSL